MFKGTSVAITAFETYPQKLPLKRLNLMSLHSELIITNLFIYDSRVHIRALLAFTEAYLMWFSF